MSRCSHGLLDGAPRFSVTIQFCKQWNPIVHVPPIETGYRGHCPLVCVRVSQHLIAFNRHASESPLAVVRTFIPR